jgi:hypothetical protein
MKNIFKSILVTIIIIGGFSSCSDSDLAIDTLYDEVNTTGSVLRILEKPLDLLNNNGGENSCLCFLVEVQQGDGSFTPDFKEVRVKIELFDNQDATPESSYTPNILYSTIPSASFDVLSEVNKLPSYYIEITIEDMIAAFPGTEIPSGATFIVTNFELEMNELDEDGNNIVWNVSNAGATLSGPYFESPFLWKTIYINN